MSNEEAQEDEVITYGKRIKFIKQDNMMISHKIFTDGERIVRVMIDTTHMVYKFVDPVTGILHKTGGEGINNLEVLQRHVKRDLKEFLGVHFDEEKRKVNE